MKSIYEILDIDVIKKQISNIAYCEKTKQDILSMKYNSDYEKINTSLDMLEDAFKIEVKFASPSLEEIEDIEELLNLIEKDYILNIEEFRSLYKLIIASLKIEEFIARNPIEENNKIYYIMKSLNNLKTLKASFDKIFNYNFEIKEDASSTLFNIKMKIENELSFLKKKLNEITKTHKEIITGNLTMRNGRYAIPVLSTHKYSIKGIVIDSSSSTKTSYVEPEVAYEVNNKISRLEEQYQEEIYRILSNLSGIVKEKITELKNNYYSILEIDYYFAKAIYAYKNDCCKPIVSKEKDLVFKGLRHPFIDKEKVVKNNLNFRKEKDLLLISGPNAGGKTVLLKAISLASLMMQMGLYVFADEATLGVFDNYYVDLGDNQSIINSLSTFSSHLLNLKMIVDNATKNDFIILDELGSSTDPKEGESLAVAICDYLINKNIKGIVTTHFSNLKNFALNNPKCYLVSMEFNLNSLIPTYKLIEDSTGNSYAYEIAFNMGVKREIIEHAKQLKKEFSTIVEISLENLEKLRLELEEKNKEVLALKEELEEELNNQKRINDDLTNQLNKAKSNANEQIIKYIEEAKDEIDKMLLSLADENKQHKFIDSKGKLEKQILELDEKTSNYDFKLKDEVYVKSIGRIGTIENIKNDVYLIVLDNMKISVAKIDLEPWTNQKDVKKSKSTHKIKGFKSVSTELNVIGQRYEDAKTNIIKYLDDAMGASLKIVRIIHGFGTGTLRNLTHEILKSSKFVKDYHYGGPSDGGMGATIVEFK